VVAYTVTQHPPLPYRLKSSTLRFEIPSINISSLLPDTKFFRVMRESRNMARHHEIPIQPPNMVKTNNLGDRVRISPSISSTNRHQCSLRSPTSAYTHSLAIPPIPRPNNHPPPIPRLPTHRRPHRPRRQRNRRHARRRSQSAVTLSTQRKKTDMARHHWMRRSRLRTQPRT
jgi:hypothetical protein